MELLCDANKKRHKDSTVHWLAWNRAETTWKFVKNGSHGVVFIFKDNSILKLKRQPYESIHVGISKRISDDLSTAYMCLIWWKNNTVSLSNKVILRYPCEF